ncbi:MAG: DUF1569 domain-containing protein [Bacteroidetes bacterium]|nr:DUF1569 domain-containing protein [Bacteroidota bacterium]
MEQLDVLLDELESKIQDQELIKKEVSASSIGWHLEHTFLVINQIINILKQSNPNQYSFTFKPIKYIVFFTGKIPRGKAKNPKNVEPNLFTKETLMQHLVTTKRSIKELNIIAKNQFFKHPFFGDLKLNEAIKFIQIHTKHHLKIINDIKK